MQSIHLILRWVVVGSILTLAACQEHQPLEVQSNYPFAGSDIGQEQEIVYPMGGEGPAAVLSQFGPIADTANPGFHDIPGHEVPEAIDRGEPATLEALSSGVDSRRYLVRFKPRTATPTVASGFRASLSVDEFQEGLGAVSGDGIRILLIHNHLGTALLEVAEGALPTLQDSPYVDDIVADGPLYQPGADSLHWSIVRINSPSVWSLPNGKGELSVVHIIDSGVSLHPDVGNNSCTPYYSGSGCVDEIQHGTAVQGAMRAPQNGFGTVGSAPSSGPASGTRHWDTWGAASTSYTRAAKTWAYNNILAYQKAIVNMSYWGGSYQLWEANNMAALANNGALIVGIAGNSGTYGTQYPGGYPNVIGVAGSNEGNGSGSPAGCQSSTSTGPHVDLVAPYKVYTTTASGGYGSACGTSFSAPLVAGIAASVWSIHNTETRNQIVNRLTSTARPLLWYGSGHGLVDHAAAAN